jgi:two-component system OmpR family sensor kinase
VDSLVYAHGGTVSVTTAPGQGCRFTVNLPRIADVAVPVS